MSEYENQQVVYVTAQGDAFTFDRVWWTKPPRTKSKRGKENCGLGECEPYRKATDKCFRATKSRLIEALCGLKEEPTYFLTLMTPRNQRPFIDYAEECEVFAKFKRLLKYHFPDCWFIYKVEWDSEAKIHYHMIGRFHRPHALPISPLPQIKAKVKALWQAASGVSYDKSVDLLFYDERHKSYLTARKKYQEDIRCLEIIGNSRMWGYINKKYIPFHTKKSFKLTARQFELFSSYIDKFLYSRYPDSISHRIQLSRPCGRVSFVPHKVIKAAIRYAKSRG